jgi:formamidopyrimidine-DNA glycosylase
MPELPEVETTVRSLNKHIRGLVIDDVWSSYDSSFHDGKDNIKNLKYFDKFKKAVVGKKFVGAERKAKNIIINLSGGVSILVHMKMTGHFLYGKYKNQGDSWIPEEKGPLQDPMNRFIRLVFALSNKKYLAFSDLRRFAKIYYFPTKDKNELGDIKIIGPEPLSHSFAFNDFKKRLLTKPNGKIKQVLMDQTVIAGIGNIYSDEILWQSGVHPFSKPGKVPDIKLRAAFKAMKKILEKAIEIGGDSTSDFRDINGKKGGYQNFHKAYKQTGKHCSKRNCKGRIVRIKMGGRSAHFCPIHQVKY